MAFYGKYNMLLDVYEMTESETPSGQVIQEWDYDEPSMTIKCIVRGFPASGLRNVGSGEDYGRYPEDIEYIRIKTTTRLTKNHRVGNVRTVDRWGDVTQHWVDDEENDELAGPEIFDVLGINATQDPWGRLMEYEVLAKKPND